MLKAAMLLIGSVLMALMTWSIVQDPLVIAMIAGLLFVVVAPLVIDRDQPPKGRRPAR